MSETDPHLLTTLLRRVGRGDGSASNELVELIYPELRRVAANRLRRERTDHTLSPTALISELYLRLFSGSRISWQNRAHFFAIAAKHMRFILVDHARRRKVGDGEQVSITLADINDPKVQARLNANLDVLALNEALDRLAVIRSRATTVVEMRFFGGMTETDIAEHLGLNVATIRRDWQFAKAWLYAELKATQQST